MKIRVVVVGRLKERYLQAAEQEYLGRLKHYADVEVHECRDAAAFWKRIPDPACLVLLDSRGKNSSSEELAELIGKAEMGELAPLVFGIGGAEGFSDEERSRANHQVAFGRITLPHRLARILLAEQLYRAFTIRRGEPYHK